MNQEMEKVLERVRKLLAMANDVSSPNEAAIAAKRAEFLIRKYQLENADLLVGELNASDVNEEFEWVSTTGNTWKQWIAVRVAELNECQVRIRGHRLERGFVFQGVGPDPIVCVEMYKYLTTTTIRLSKEQTSGRAAINSFQVGCATELCARLVEMRAERQQDFSTSSGTALVVHKKALVEEVYGQARYRNTKSKAVSDYDAYHAGRRAGATVSLQEQLK